MSTNHFIATSVTRNDLKIYPFHQPVLIYRIYNVLFALIYVALEEVLIGFWTLDKVYI